MMLIGGIGTTTTNDEYIKEEQAEQARLIAGTPVQTQNLSNGTSWADSIINEHSDSRKITKGMS